MVLRIGVELRLCKARIDCRVVHFTLTLPSLPSREREIMKGDIIGLLAITENKKTYQQHPRGDIADRLGYVIGTIISLYLI